MPTITYSTDGIFPISGTLVDYTITQIEIAGGGGGAGHTISTNTDGGGGANIKINDISIGGGVAFLNIYVGTGGHSLLISTSGGGGGGGSSKIITDTGVILTISGAGGGGGQNTGSNGGNGGTPVGQNGSGNNLYTGKGGNNSNGGVAGQYVSGLLPIDGSNAYLPNPVFGGNGGLGIGENEIDFATGGTGNGGNSGGSGGGGVGIGGGGGGGGGYGGGGGGSTGDGGGGGGASFVNPSFSSTIIYSVASNGGNVLNFEGGNGYITITYNLNTSICLLSDCEVLLSNFTLKNITEITLSDEVFGYFSKRPEKIKKVIKHSHFINFLEDTNKPYLIEKNAFGSNVPDKDIHLSGHHRIIAHSEDNHFVGVQTFKLENCKKEIVNPDEVDYYHIILENKGVGLIVNNLPVEDCIE